MKNIHVLPTDKPSRLFKHQLNEITLNISKHLLQRNYGFNIYITSDEEIKEGDWYLTSKNTLCKCIKTDSKYVYSLEGGSSTNCKKIILTTDQDLIKDGVQAIDDEFLEWFVKNPNCEEVEVEINSYMDKNISDSITFTDYKIIIPKEEPNSTGNIVIDYQIGKSKVIQNLMLIDAEIAYNSLPKEEPKQETLEEVAEKFATDKQNEDTSKYYIALESFQLGAKWQQKQDKNKYSEEDMKQFGLYLGDNLKKLKGKTIDEIFEEFKKK